MMMAAGRKAVRGPISVQFSSVCVFITTVPIIKFAWGEGDSGGHVLRETTSRRPVWTSQFSSRANGDRLFFSDAYRLSSGRWFSPPSGNSPGAIVMNDHEYHAACRRSEIPVNRRVCRDINALHCW
jgi:hypothetical protein